MTIATGPTTPSTWSTRIGSQRLPLALALVQFVVVLTRSLGRDGAYARESVHYLGADAASIATLLNPSPLTAASWAACSVLVLAAMLSRRGTGTVATTALTLCLMVSPLAWEAFRPGSPFALSVLAGLAVFQSAVSTLYGRSSPLWAGASALLAVLVNTTNTIGVLAVLSAAVLALVPWFRPPAATARRVLAVLGCTLLGATIALVSVSRLAPPLNAATVAVSRPLTLPDVAEQFRMPFEGGILGATVDFGAAPSYPFHVAITVGLWWIVTGGTLAATIIHLSDRRFNALTTGIALAAVLGGTATVVLLSRASGAGFDFDGLATASIIPMFLLVTGPVAKNQVVGLTIAVSCAVLLCALLVWTVIA